MKIARFEYGNQIRRGIVQGQEIELVGDLSLNPTGESVALAEVRLLAPVDPPNVLALGLNYRRHAAETGMKVPERPLLFIKANTSVIGPGAPIILPGIAPDEVDYEAEMCIVIGKKAKNVSLDDALDYVFGYTCGNDVSARDCQLRLDGQWARGKSFDTFCPLGPWIETELPNPDKLTIRSLLNGQVMQDSSTSDLIFNCREIISFLSHNLTLLPGTVIMTGTPSGVGMARTPPVYMRAGDVIEIEIEGIGTLSNPVKSEY